MIFLFVFLVEALPSSQQSVIHARTFSLVEPVLSNEDKVSCSRTQHHASGEIRTHRLVIKSPEQLS